MTMEVIKDQNGNVIQTVETIEASVADGTAVVLMRTVLTRQYAAGRYDAALPYQCDELIRDVTEMDTDGNELAVLTARTLFDEVTHLPVSVETLGSRYDMEGMLLEESRSSAVYDYLESGAYSVVTESHVKDAQGMETSSGVRSDSFSGPGVITGSEITDTTYAYDEDGLLLLETHVFSSLGDAGQLLSSLVMETSYDPDTQLISAIQREESLYEGDAEGDALLQRTVTDASYEHRVDGYSEIATSRITDGSGLVTGERYSVTVYDANDAVVHVQSADTSFVYDDEGFLIQTTMEQLEQDGQEMPLSQQTVVSSYDMETHLLAMVISDGTLFSAGDVLEILHEEAVYTYDDTGAYTVTTLSSTQNVSGSEISRREQVQAFSAEDALVSDLQSDSVYAYDAGGLVAQVTTNTEERNGNGIVLADSITIQDFSPDTHLLVATGTEANRYSDEGDLLEHTSALAVYTYAANGYTVVTGIEVTDADGILISRHEDSQAFDGNDVPGVLSSTDTALAYDDAGILQSVVETRQQVSEAGVVLAVTVTETSYDADSELPVTSHEESSAFNAADGELLATTFTDSSYEYTDSGHAVISQGRTLDAAGQLTAESSLITRYDADGVTAFIVQESTAYAYDAQGVLVSTTVNASETGMDGSVQKTRETVTSFNTATGLAASVATTEKHFAAGILLDIDNESGVYAHDDSGYTLTTTGSLLDAAGVVTGSYSLLATHQLDEDGLPLEIRLERQDFGVAGETLGDSVTISSFDPDSRLLDAVSRTGNRYGDGELLETFQEQRSYSYDDTGAWTMASETRVLDAEGLEILVATESQVFSSAGVPGMREISETASSYDASGSLVGTLTTTQTLDANGYRIRELSAETEVDVSTQLVVGIQTQITHYAATHAGDVLSVDYADTRYSYAAEGRTETSQGRTEDAEGVLLSDFSATTLYDANDDVVDAQLTETDYAYDEAGNLLQSVAVWKQHDGAGVLLADRTTTSISDPDTQMLATVTAVSSIYDEGSLLEHTVGESAYVYAADGSGYTVTTSSETFDPSETLISSSRTTQSFDPEGVAGALVRSVAGYEYDDAGNLVRKVEARESVDASGNVTADGTTETSYDTGTGLSMDAHAEDSTYADGSLTLLTVTDSHFDHDSHGYTVTSQARTTNAAEVLTGVSDITTRYDASDAVAYVDSEITSYQYDAEGVLAKISIKSSESDASGQLVTAQETVKTMDTVSQLVTAVSNKALQYSAGALAETSIEEGIYTYDSDGYVIAFTGRTLDAGNVETGAYTRTERHVLDEDGSPLEISVERQDRGTDGIVIADSSSVAEFDAETFLAVSVTTQASHYAAGDLLETVDEKSVYVYYDMGGYAIETIRHVNDAAGSEIGLLEQVQYFLPSGAPGMQESTETAFDYDDNGQLQRKVETIRLLDENGWLSSETTRETSLDVATQVVDAVHSETFEYSVGEVSRHSVSDSDYVYGQDGYTVTLDSSTENASELVLEEVASTFTYDANDALVHSVVENTAYQYDDEGLLSQTTVEWTERSADEVLVAEKLTTSTFDPDSHLLSVVTVEARKYDEAGELLEQSVEEADYAFEEDGSYVVTTSRHITDAAGLEISSLEQTQWFSADDVPGALSQTETAYSYDAEGSL
ncbi:MAG: hypothetical protein RIQ52_77, partial [Pseudomonadota bacterium]